MPRSRWRSADDGFTLVELLASLAVLSMLSLMLATALGERSLAWARMDRDTSNGETVEAVQAILYERVEHIWPATIYTQVQPGPDFDGETAQATFLAPPPAAKGPGPLRRYQLMLNTGGELVLDSLSDVALDRHHWSDHQVLMHGVQALDLAYFGTRAPSRTPAWSNDWSQQAGMPSLIRIRVGFAPGDRRRWPDLVVRPRADIDTDCVLTVANGGCKGR